MHYGTVAMKISIVYLLNSMFLGLNGDVSYVPKVTDNVFSCDNYKNEFLDCDELIVGSMKGDDGDDAAKLSGKIKTKKNIESDFDFEVDVWKIMALGDEYMWHSRINFCSSLEDTSTPWYPIIEKLNISSCPVPVSIFEVEDMTISLDAVSSVMSYEFCGEYRVELSFIDITEKISCHVIEICIVEEEYE